MSEGELTLTPGVEKVPGGWIFPAVGHAIPESHPELRAELLRCGFASESRSRAARLLPGSQSALLPPGTARAIAASLAHNVMSMRAALALCLLSVAAGFAFAASFLQALGLLGAMLLVSILIHEAGHVLAFRAVRRTATAVMVAKGVSCALVRPVLPRRADLLVVCAGPLLPTLVCAGAIPLAWSAPLVFWTWAAIAGGHAITLLVPVGDGRHMMAIVRGAAAVTPEDGRVSPALATRGPASER